MRAVLVLLLLALLLFPTSAELGFAEDDAAKRVLGEDAALSATRNLLRVLNRARGPDRLDALERYVDVAGMALEIFGFDAAQDTPREQRKMHRNFLRFLTIAMFEKMPKPPEPDDAKIVARVRSDGRQQVSYQLDSETVHLLWARGDPAPMLADIGDPREGFVTEMANHLWKVSGKKPAAFVKELLATITKGPREAGIKKSKDNLRSMVMIMIARRTERTAGGYPPYSGKNFVLSLVATNQLDRRNPENLEILFSPGDDRRSLKKAGMQRFKDIHKRALKSGADFSDLTSYAGRRNDENEYLVTPDQEKMGTALIADLSFEDVAIVAFSNGGVRVMTREDLGLGPDDPIVAGEKSKSKILRPLSSE